MGQHPLRDDADVAGLLGKGNEFGWRDEAARGVLPADESFDEMLTALAERHPRLIDQRELVVVDSLLEVAHQRQALLAVLVVAVVPHDDPELVALGGAHRDVGALQQLARIVAVIGTHGDADAGPDIDDVAVERHPHFERTHDGLGDALGIADAAACHEDGELVAADAGDAVASATDDGAQAGRHLAQQHVADRMTERFVDVPEVVEIEDQHGDRRAGARAARRSPDRDDRRTARASASPVSWSR